MLLYLLLAGLFGVPLVVFVVLLRLHHRLKKLEGRVDELELPSAAERRREALSSEDLGALPRRARSDDVIPEGGADTEDAREDDAEEPPAQPPADAAEAPAEPPTRPPTEEPETAEEPESEPWWDGLEETLWTRLPVWIGAVALALAAAYLVKLSFERGWIRPAVRVAFGIFGGVALLVLGDRLRRSSAYVAQGLSAAGVAALFVSFWAATNLYALVPPAAGFALMALTTATAVGLSLRHGYLVAVLGLVGGLLTPALVQTEEPRTWALFGYLLLLQLGLIVVARRRRWGSLGLLSLAGGFFWVFAFLAGPFGAGDSLWLGLFLLASLTAFTLQVAGLGLDLEASAWEGSPVGRWIGWGGLSAGLVALSWVGHSAAWGTLEWAFLGLLLAGCLAVARLDEDFHGLAWLAAGIVTADLWLWLDVLDSESAGRYLLTHAALGGGLALAAWGASFFRSRRAGAWGALSAVVGVVYLLVVVAYENVLGLEGFHWGVIAVLTGALYVAGAVPWARRRSSGGRERGEEAEKPLAALAVGATVLFSLALPLELEREWLSVAWALEIPALMWLASRLRVDALRKLAWIFSGIVTVRLLVNPMVLTYPIGETPLWNWLLWGYGLPLVAVFGASVLARSNGWGKLEEALQWLTLGLLFAFVTLQIRQTFHPGDLDHGSTSFLEWGLYLSAWSSLAWLALVAEDRWPVRPLHWGSRGLLLFVLGTGSLVLGLAKNPAWSHEWVGDVPVVNFLLVAYGAPALLLFLALQELDPDEVWLRRLLSVALLVDVFVLVSLEVRQAFRGGYLDAGSAGQAESYALSFAWIVLGVVLALFGARGSRMLRWGSLAVLLPATLKVFLVDTSHLEGLWRVASLVGLGATLFALAYFFQRFVFGKDRS